MNGNEVIVFIFVAKFASNVTNNVVMNSVVYNDVNEAHAIAKHFVNFSIAFVVMLRESDLLVIVKIFARKGFMFGAALCIFDHCIVV